MSSVEQSVALPAISVILYLMAVIMGGASTKYPRLLAWGCFGSAFLGGITSGWLLALVLRFPLTWFIVSCVMSGLAAMGVAFKIYSQRDEW